ncbi:MAG TPA: DUF4340 domain-containing protein [Planctomycetota bacterium]|nr:DUF4340 domain-containing protein [Planctomycetota bacterium]
MNRITPIAILVLLALAGAWVLVFEVREETRFRSEEELREAASRVFHVGDVRAAAARVDRLEVARTDDTIAFERTGETWRMVKPVQGGARSDILNELVGMVLTLRKMPGDITPDEMPGGELKAYGLDRPRAVLRMSARGEGGETVYALRIGDAGTARAIYAQLAESPNVMRVDRRVVEYLLRPVNDYRETRFLRFDPKRVRSLSVDSDTSRVLLERADDLWRVTRPFSDRAAALRVQDLLKTLAGVEAKTFVTESSGDLAAYGLDRPRLRVGFTRDDGTGATALFGGPADKPVGTVYAKLEDEPTVYTVADDVIGPLTFRPEFLRDRKFAWVSPLLVTELRIEGPGRVLHLRKEGRTPAWKLLEPVKMDADGRTVENFLRLLAALEIVRFPDDDPDPAALARCGLDEGSRVRLSLTASDRGTQVYTVGRVDPVEKDLYVRRDDAGPVYTVGPDFRDMVTAPWLLFRTRVVAHVDPSAMTALTVRSPDRTVTVERIDSKNWRMTAPVNAPADAINLQNLLEYLRDLQAADLIAEKVDDLAAWGLEKPEREVRMRFEGAADRVLLVGKRVGDEGWAAKLADADLVFTLPDTFIELMERELRSRAVWKFDRRDVTALQWQKDDERIVLRSAGRRREGPLWIVVRPPGREINFMQFNAVLAALENLSVRKFESYTRTDLARCGLDKPRLTVTLVVADAPRTFSVGAPKDRDSVYAMTSDVEGVFTVPATTVKTLEAGLLFPPEAP